MVIPVHENQLALLNKGTIEPRVLVTLVNTSGTLRFTNNDTFVYQNEVYQPFVGGLFGFKSSANYPENKAGTQVIRLTLLNDPITLSGTSYTHLSKTLTNFDWEMANADVRLLLVSGTSTQELDADEAIPIMTKGVVGVPQDIKRDSFSLPLSTRNSKLNDLIPLRVLSTDDFSELDPDEDNGRTYIPIVIGEDVEIRGISTTAGAVTTVRTEVNTGAILDVSDTVGFSDSDTFFIGGRTNRTFTIGTVDTPNDRFTGITPDLSVDGLTYGFGDIVNETRANFDYTLADHKIGGITKVFVTQRGENEPVLVDPSNYSKLEVVDANSVGGTRSDLRVTSLFPFGVAPTEGALTQPVTEVDNANHKHDVQITSEASTIRFATDFTPSTAGAIIDGADDTGFSITSALGQTRTVTFDDFPAVPGTFVKQRFFVLASSTLGGSGRFFVVRQGSSNILLSLPTAFPKAEYRSMFTSIGNSTDRITCTLVGAPVTAFVFEGRKEVITQGQVTEQLRDLTDTTRTVNVAHNITAANLAVGSKLTVVCSGVQGTDFHPSNYGTGTMTRPDHVMRWLIQEALGEADDVMDLTSYATAGARYATESIGVQLAIQKPTTLDNVADQVMNASRSLHFWGPAGHTISFLEDPANITAASGTYREDESGVIDITWQDATSIKDIRNSLTANFRRDWTKTATNDESYAGKVSAEDIPSQGRFGVLTNEVRGVNKDFFFDFVPDSTQMTGVLNFILDQKKEPRKKYTVTTDWTQLAIAPGDIIDVQASTTITGSLARVIDNTIDPRFFCTITALEVKDN